MALSDKELEKIKLMQQFRTGERTDLPNVDSDEFKLSKIKSMLDKANTNENNIKEMTRDTFERMDGLVDQSLLIKFLDTFEEIYGDYVEGGDEFFSDDVINYLSMMMQNRAQDARLDSRSFEEGINEGKSREEVKSIISKYLDADDTKDYLNMNYDDVKNMSTSDILDDLKDTASSAPLASYKRNLQEVDGGVEFFKRIAFKK